MLPFERINWLCRMKRGRAKVVHYLPAVAVARSPALLQESQVKVRQRQHSIKLWEGCQGYVIMTCHAGYLAVPAAKRV